MTHRDDAGNVQVDFVWGNLPLQPNDDRSDQYISIPSYQDTGWTHASKTTSDTLRTSDYQVQLNNLEYSVPADSHDIATGLWANYPEFMENAGYQD